MAIAGGRKWQPPSLAFGEFRIISFSSVYFRVDSLVKRKMAFLAYYAFYARHWNGPVELRGLESRDYHVVDYVNHKEFGVEHGPRGRILMEFDKYILLETR